MTWEITVGTILVSVLLIIISKFIFVKFIDNEKKSGMQDLVKKINTEKEEIARLLRDVKDFASKKQINNVHLKIAEMEKGLSDSSMELVKIDVEVKEKQKSNEEKELAQEELKVSKEKDEEDLQVLLSQYEKNSSEAFELEKNLASEITDVGVIRKDSDLTNGQQDFIDGFNDTLNESARNLRSLITEYGQMTNKVSAINEQLNDLEIEYSKLIESHIDGDCEAINECIKKE